MYGILKEVLSNLCTEPPPFISKWKRFNILSSLGRGHNKSLSSICFIKYRSRIEFSSIKEKILIDLQLSCCNYGCIFFFQAKHGTQSYFIIQNTGSFQRFFKFGLGDFQCFLALIFYVCSGCQSFYLLCLWLEGAAKPSWWGGQGGARVSVVGLCVFRKDLISEWRRACSLGHHNQTHWAAGRPSLCFASCSCNLTPSLSAEEVLYSLARTKVLSQG